MEFDKLSPYILRGELYVKEIGEVLPSFYKGFEDTMILTNPNNKEVYIKIKGHLCSYLMPLNLCNDFVRSTKFVIRIGASIYFYNMNVKEFYFSPEEFSKEQIKITYFQLPYLETLVFNPNKQFQRNLFSRPFFTHRETANLFLISRNGKTYLIVIL